MTTTLLNIDDIIRERKREAYERGTLDDLVMTWTPKEWVILSQFTGKTEGRVYYLGAHHEQA